MIGQLMKRIGQIGCKRLNRENKLFKGNTKDEKGPNEKY